MHAVLPHNHYLALVMDHYLRENFFTQKAFADFLRFQGVYVHPATVGRWRKGGHWPRLEALEVLLYIFSIQPSKLEEQAHTLWRGLNAEQQQKWLQFVAA